MATPSGKRILLGISAGIAAYKSAHLARLLKKAGHEVRVVMTDGAQAFITPLTLQALTGEPVRTSLLDPEAEAGMGHIELARWAELILIAPATADLMARLVHGHADDLLTTLCLASDADKAMAPAMNQAMWRHPATARNTRQLEADGWWLLGPDAGDQACGDVGPGRMLEPETIVDTLFKAPSDAPLMAPDAAPWMTPDTTSAEARPAQGLTVTITAGPTREPLDPVRYLSNHSSGKMGYALAEAAAALGATVHLISGPVSLATPSGVNRIDVTSANEMAEVAYRLAAQSDVFVGCAAVADYRAANVSEHKIKKSAENDELTLTLVKNPDIIAEVAKHRAGAPRPFMVGFAAETRDVETYARDKLARKGLDMIVANDVSLAGLGFGADHNAALLLWPSADEASQSLGRRALPAQSKATLAAAILDCLLERLEQADATASSIAATPDSPQDPQ
jgi:phosphopantothenoylcysteine decarboxylase/phosphopantothenate--cysteine ligase